MLRIALMTALLTLTATPARAQLFAAVLPSSRSVETDRLATAFATIINTGSVVARGCSIAPASPVPAAFTYQTTDALTNAPTGTADTPVDIPAGGSQSFVFAFTASAPITADIPLSFGCANLPAAPITPGVNTFRLLACSGTVADYVSVAATPTHDGIVAIPGATGTGAFSAAAANVGPSGSTGGCARTFAPPVFYISTVFHVTPEATTSLVSAAVCLTDAAGQCQAPPTPSLSFNPLQTGQVATFSVFLEGGGTVPFSPATNRVNVRFEEWAAVHDIFCMSCPFLTYRLVGLRGTTSVAVTTGATE